MTQQGGNNIEELTEEQVREIFSQRRATLQPTTEEWVRELAREEIWLALAQIRWQKLEDTEAYYEFASEMGYPPPP